MRESTVETVPQLVATQVARRSDEIAVRGGGRGLTYRQLWERSTGLMRRLRQAGAGPGAVVAIAASRSPDLVVAILAVIRAGAAYLPLDPVYPRERLEFMLDDAGVRILVTDGTVAAELPPANHTLVLDTAAEDSGDEDAPVTYAGGADVCYLMYTSGSTGIPKGVMLEHRALVNLVCWQLDDSKVGSDARTLQYAPTSFDVSFQEIFCTLASGGTLVCIDEPERRDPMRLWRLLVEQRINRLFVPFIALQALSLFAEGLPHEAPPLQEVVTAGEQLQCTRQLRRLFGRLPGCRLVNQYGPTETHVVSRYLLPSDPADWPELPPIGEPIDNVTLHILDKNLKPVPPGEEGVLFVSGIAVARGYLGRPDLTAQRFLRGPDGERMYRTGDVVALDDSSQLLFRGREDDQMKVSGYRIEPAEVESALLHHSAVAEAAATVKGTAATERRLVAYVVREDAEAPLPDLRSFLRSKVPDHLVPWRIYAVDALPRTPSGKLDRARLGSTATAATVRA